MNFEEFQGLIAEGLGVDKEKVTMEADLASDLGADSLDAVELIMELEDEFDVTIDDESAQGFKTVKDIYNYLEAKLK
ncbi:acyl carrier protein [Candidatus Izemoplasma sp. B36]|uniref:acyl carrier protein n=1 Tax=Candidatus Izemoplasma sp. B36 TaxID=3242468 RepID=UPI00355807F6